MKTLKNLFLFATTFMSSALFAEEAPEMPRDQGFMQTLMMIAIALVFFYFIMWRPEQKRRKAMEEQRSAIKVGDKVTAVGILGTVSAIKDNTLILKMVDGSKIEVLKAAITDVISGNGDEESKSKAE